MGQIHSIMLSSTPQLLYWSKDRDEMTQDAVTFTDKAFVMCDGVSQSFLPENMSYALSREFLPVKTGGRTIEKGLLMARKRYRLLTRDTLSQWNYLHNNRPPAHYLHHLKKGRLGASTMVSGHFNQQAPLLHSEFVGDCNILALDHNLNIISHVPFSLEYFPDAPDVVDASNGQVVFRKVTTQLSPAGFVLIATDAMAKYILQRQDDLEFLKYLCTCDDLISFRKRLLSWWRNGLEADDITLLRYNYTYH